MISIILSFLLFAPDSYQTSYPSESREAMETFESCRKELKKALGDATDEDVKVAFAIVAPEVSCYSLLVDYYETTVLKNDYPLKGTPDYSIGIFQMKPSFVESLEREVQKDISLKRKYGSRLTYKSKDKVGMRRERVNRLSKTSWQVVYLAVFVDVVEKRTAGWGLKSNEEKVRCWATLYNAGFYLSKARVKQRQGVKQFPRGTDEFNYSAVAVEFYNSLGR
jgi:hypothetical protein